MNNRYSGFVPQNNLNATNRGMITRHGGDLTQTDPLTTGMYNSWLGGADPLFDLAVDDALIGLVWVNQLHPIFSVLGIRNTDELTKDRGYITYIGAKGSQAGTQTSGIISDPCASGDGSEFGSAVARVTGFSRFRRSSEVHDITIQGLKSYQRQQLFFVNGDEILDDYTWNIMQLAHVQINDLHNWFIDGDATNAGETDGLYNLLDGTAVDAVTGNPVPALANWVVDWNSTPILASGAGATTTAPIVNAITQGTSIWTMLRDWLHMTRLRLQYSSLRSMNGFVIHMMTDPAMLSCLIEAWICETICGVDPTTSSARQVLDTMEARTMRAQLRSFLVSGSVPFDIDGIRVWFHGYPFGSSLDNGDGTYNFVGFVANVGGQQILELEVNDLGRGINAAKTDMGRGSYLVSDGGRFLTMETVDKTCIQYHVEIQPRFGIFNKWLGIKIENVPCDHIFPFSANPTSSVFQGIGTVTDLVAPYLYQTHTGSAVSIP